MVVNKDLMRAFGIEEAILLGELASEYEYLKKQYAIENEWFYSTVENIEKNTTLSKYKQKKDKNESVVNPNFREKNEKK
jgi:hypothetical protein